MPRKKAEYYDISLKHQVAKEVVNLGHRQCDVARSYDLSDKLVSRWVIGYKEAKGWAKSNTQKAQDNELYNL